MKMIDRMHKPEKQQILMLLLALVVQVISFGVVVPLHSVFSHMGPLLQEPCDVGGEMSEPTVGRLVFGICFFVFGIILVIVSHFLDKKNKETISFGCAFCAGVMFWQSIGECLWHFQIGGIQITRIECIQSLPLVIVFVILLIVFGFDKNKDFSLWVCILSFACNWLGHYITIGTYSFVCNVVDWKLWAYVWSGVAGGIATLIGLFLSLFCCKTKKEILLASMLIFIGIGVIYFGFTEA